MVFCVCKISSIIRWTSNLLSVLNFHTQNEKKTANEMYQVKTFNKVVAPLLHIYNTYPLIFTDYFNLFILAHECKKNCIFCWTYNLIIKRFVNVTRQSQCCWLHDKCPFLTLWIHVINKFNAIIIWCNVIFVLLFCSPNN